MRGQWIPALMALGLASCGFEKPAPLTNAAPADSTAVALLDLARLRAAPAYDRLPPALRSLAEPLAGVKQLVLAWNGQDLLMLAGGFEQPPAGYTPIEKGIAASGTSGRVDAARQALAAGSPHALVLPQGTAELYASIRGDGKLPLAGNLSNAGHLLSMASASRAIAHVGTDVELEVEAQCATSSQALQLEESLRAMLTLAAAGAKEAPVAQMLRDTRVTRENILIRVRLVAKPAALSKALGGE
jgi:hypothetical protein